MKATRIFLFMSPLLIFVPPLIPVDQTLGIALVDFFYKGVLSRFPGNILMAFLCYTYANHIGRESWLWVGGSMVAPALAPFILACRPAEFGSAAELEERKSGKKRPSQAQAGAFEARFPLLSAWLATQAPVVAADARATMESVLANFEFSAYIDQQSVEPLRAAAVPMKFTLWVFPESPGVRVFGAGMVEPKAVEGVANWLRKVAPQRKISTALHPNEGPTKFVEYYPRAG